MNQHIANAKVLLKTAEGFGVNNQPELMTLATLAIAEALLSIAESLHRIELENEELSQKLGERND
jgi:hypothetical protein